MWESECAALKMGLFMMNAVVGVVGSGTAEAGVTEVSLAKPTQHNQHDSERVIIPQLCEDQLGFSSPLQHLALLFHTLLNTLSTKYTVFISVCVLCSYCRC